MLLPGREWQEGYRFGFNGKEQDVDINIYIKQLNFGARLLNTMTGIWLSPDKLITKFPAWSPYSFAMASPISNIDIDGNENVIYLVVLPSAYATLSVSDIQNIKNLANSNFQALGVKTRVFLADEACNCEMSAFDPAKIDLTDGITVIGAAADVKDYINLLDKNNSMKWDDFADIGNISNPETSENKGTTGIGKWTAIDASDIVELTSFITTDDTFIDKKAQLGALFINHGVGHQAGMDHTGSELIDDQYTTPSDDGFTFSYIMQSGTDLINDINNPNIGYERLTSDSFEHRVVTYYYDDPKAKAEEKRRVVTTYNQDYDSYLKSRFSDNEAKVNYKK